MKSIYTYCDENGISDVLELLKEADEKVREKFKYQLVTMFQNNQILREPHTKHFVIEKYKELYEFRIKVAKKVIRILFCERGNSIILLHAFYKHGKKDTECALEYAVKLLENMDRSSLLPFERLKAVIIGYGIINWTRS